MHTHMQAQKTQTHACAHTCTQVSKSCATKRLESPLCGRNKSCYQASQTPLSWFFIRSQKPASRVFKSRAITLLKNMLRGPCKSRPTIRLKLHFLGFPYHIKSPFRGLSNPALPSVSSSTSLIFYNDAIARFTSF